MAGPAAEDSITANDVTVDPAARTVTCPAGITRRVTAKNVSSSGRLSDLPAARRCTISKSGRALHLHEHDGLLRAARADWSAGTGLVWADSAPLWCVGDAGCVASDSLVWPELRRLGIKGYDSRCPGLAVPLDWPRIQPTCSVTTTRRLTSSPPLI